MLDRITAHTPLGPDELKFLSLQGSEQLSRPFAFQVALLSQNFHLDRRALLGQSVTLAIPTQNLLTPRYLNGKVTEAALRNEEIDGTRYALYQLRLEPDLWPMMRDRNLRIFQQQTVPQIVKTLLAEQNVQCEDRLTGSYRQWEYCVQYQESSYNYISRLMELEGIYYFFRHEMGKHTLVLMDAPQSHQPFKGYESIPYHVTASGGTTREEGVSQWAVNDVVTPGIYSLDDYDFRKPNAWLFQARQNPASPKPGQIDVYDWPGRFVDHQHGEFYARIRQEAWQAEHQQISATGTALGIAPGHTFSLHNAPSTRDSEEYLVTRAEYRLRDNPYASGGEASEQRIDFNVIPADIVFRPRQEAEWPKTYGPQTARVVGPKGESIWTDKYGRIKVKFHWDRLAAGDDTSSCWVRVSSAWAGQGFGGVQIPRVNDEVVIDFINGDPDRPLVIGRVYNEASMPPWALPAAATQMGFMSRTKDGSAENANALRLEDKAGAEQVWIQAERNMDTNVKMEESHTVGTNRTKTVGADETSHIKQNRTKNVDGNETVAVGQNRTKTISGNETTTIKQNRSDTIEGNETLTVQQNRSESITGNHDATVKGNQTMTVSQERSRTVNGNEKVSIAKNRSVQVTGHQTLGVNGNREASIGGNENKIITKKQEVSIGAGRSIVINGGDTRYTDGTVSDGASQRFQISVGESTGIMLSPGSIEIVAGGASITINADGVMVNGSKIELNA
ncbi:type VI secretion system tip protein VgrG [Jejubacter calystegiae]|uniref:Type VI secretion system tip protein VgrG n=1 Tax=Jejubacter calystegiae TaxID=2579935 RepID=A0A4P8YKP0_9ENTR|nr:type VI secretion system tip protein TssI/VgrG [Jejubacter calystegiae]QCT21335.1 type VI secretion system tip protein VgrG [Jejubacter calystegiae]